MTIATVRLVVSAVSTTLTLAAWTSLLSAQAPGVPDPARLPSRPASPGPGPAGVPPRDPSARGAPEKGTGVVRGRVVALDTGLPLRRARVALYSRGEPRATTTDADGLFTLGRLPAGQYQLLASKARYVDTPYGVRRPGGPGRSLELADGQAVEGVVLALPSAGVITGRILDDAGEVLTGVSVVPMRFATIKGERQLTQIGQPRLSDDTGTFRLFGLRPGKYYVSARSEDEQRFSGDGIVDPDATGFAPTFYPGTAVAAEAQPIEVVAGGEVVADLQLVMTRMTTVTGVVVDPAGAPATGGFIMVSTFSGYGGRSMSGGTIKPDGTFVVSGIAPGEYTLVAQPTFGEKSMFEPFGHGEGQRTASTPIVATGAPITGLRLVVQDPIRIPVNVTFEDGGADKPERVYVQANPERGMSSGTATMLDGRLSLEVVPGSYRLSAYTMSAGTGSSRPWIAKRLAYRGRELEDDQVELTAEPGGRIDVVFTTRTSSVAGGVTDDGGKLVADYLAIIMPADAEKTRRGSSRFQTALPDSQGRFRIEHLQPGSYVATAIPDAPIEDIFDADFLEGIRRAGKSFTVVEGASATVDLKLTPLP